MHKLSIILLKLICYIFTMTCLPRLSVLILCVAATTACFSMEENRESPGGANLLAKEKSPYLLQHKDNPVWWYPWGNAAFAKAAQENKIIFLSVGYSTCHWCHVMERESFMDQEVAEFMNSHFVSIKVDREERPDVDAIYMTALQQLNNGAGGWPMSLFLTPDRKPFFGTTYVPKAKLMALMKRIQTLWENDKGQLLTGADEVAEDLRAYLGTPSPGAAKGLVSMDGEDVLSRYLIESEKRWDNTHGGFQTVPKFPPAMDLMIHMRLAARSSSTADTRAIDSWVRLTLEAMARGGMYDQVGGGFHRYSTDAIWLVPHFEKMLNDNALLAQAYIEASQYFNSGEFTRVAMEICDYVLRDLQHSEGGFYTAEDADSTGKGEAGKQEGTFYLFSPSEIRRALHPDEMNRLQQVFQITNAGNFEEKTILTFKPGASPADKYRPGMKPVMKKIFRLREQRPRPPRDEKILVNWNGLMIASLASAAGVLHKPEYYTAADRAARFIWRNLYSNNSGLKHQWAGGAAGGAGYSEDYAAFIHGLLALYEADFNPGWLEQALILQQEMDTRFWSEQEQAYYRDDGTDASLLVRVVDSRDGASPAASSMALLNLLRLQDLTFDPSYGDRAGELLAGVSPRLKYIPQTLPYFLIGLDYIEGGGKELAIVGKSGAEDMDKMLTYLREHYFPAKVVAFGDPGQQWTLERVPLLQGKKMRRNKATAYVCESNICLEPTTDVNRMGRLLARRKPMPPALFHNGRE